MLTIFSSPRPFKGEFNYIQRNAILSWLTVCPGCEIILIGDDEGTDRIAAEFNLKHISKVEKNKKGVLLRNAIFKEAQKAAKNELLGFISADIILTSDFLKAVRSILFSNFLLTGRRWDLDIKEEIDFNNPEWENKILFKIKESGKLHGFSAGDYFVFPRSLDLAMPPFSVQHGGWDNWLIYRFKSLGIPIIDAGQIITIIHQNHERPHLK
ncbi:MAG: glycosyltransferase family A protein, partial [Nanoarchaeota archaeon]|nr:glycosyltransferase family A protein [Nanoarchaeota archaeon]